MNKSNTHKKPTVAFAVAALKVDLAGSPPNEIRLLPAGRFKARDGRPHELPQGWHVDADSAARLIARAQLRADDAVIDYEHQTLHSEHNGQPAPAAGWFSPQQLEWRDDGLYATNVRWTPTAELSVAQSEYRYISPVIEYHPTTGEVLGVAMAALTNYAAIDGLDGLSGLSKLAAAKFDFNSLTTTDFNHQEKTMDRAQLIALLGLAAEATDEQIKTSIAALQSKADDQATVAAALSAEVAALKAAGAAQPDPSKYVPVGVVEALKTDLAALKAAQVTSEVGALVKSALDDGKLLPAQVEWATDLGESNIAALKTYLSATPSIAALKGTQTHGRQPDAQDPQLSADEKLVIAQLGISADDFTALKTKEQ